MPLYIIRQDITKLRVDAAVNAANNTLSGGGGVDGAIHSAAGPELSEACRLIGWCDTGEAKFTKGYGMPCKYIIHTVGPVWAGGNSGERGLLKACYKNCLEIARHLGCETVAFPLISAGVYGYPKAEAMRVAVETIGEFLLTGDMTVYITVLDNPALLIGRELYFELSSRIGSLYNDAELLKTADFAPSEMPSEAAKTRKKFFKAKKSEPDPGLMKTVACCPQISPSLEEAVAGIDESFSQMLLRKIDELGMTDAECYKKANIDRKLFSKIRSDPLYRPSKQTAIAFAIALRLSFGETEELLKKAGFALSHSNKFDIIVGYFIERGNYNIFEINEALFAFDQCLLGT